jgi:hypothetical protein
VDAVHEVLYVLDGSLCESHYLHIILRISSADEFSSFVEEVEEFTTINFIKR